MSAAVRLKRELKQPTGGISSEHEEPWANFPLHFILGRGGEIWKRQGDGSYQLYEPKDLAERNFFSIERLRESTQKALAELEKKILAPGHDGSEPSIEELAGGAEKLEALSRTGSEPNDALGEAATRYHSGHFEGLQDGEIPVILTEGVAFRGPKPEITNPQVEIDSRTGAETPMTGKARKVMERKAEISPSKMRELAADRIYSLYTEIRELRKEHGLERSPPYEVPTTDRILVILGRGLRIRETQRLLGDRFYVVTYGAMLIGMRFSGIIVHPWALEDSKETTQAQRDRKNAWLQELETRLNKDAWERKSETIIYA